ncbi:CPBP family intramembrane glutamic endopeptidase [Xanthovirga aplysinae]|uniref:CPBP family intramembrane glutamic endopeptidase n=1 Tax=Xanthovirga aplysinae TaxID=2529853 RepID=UPI0012BC50A8|nr:type II CAAX endopeptidase family protein [Xanthovirga aplysinae]MTI30801.1 CPBP family intramembrane metalloprotease [Xanthovirga aplysinae]
MNKFEHKVDLSEDRNPWTSLFLLFIFTLTGLLVSNFLGFLLVLPFFNFDPEKVTKGLMHITQHPESKDVLIVIQATSAIGTFILAPWLFIRFIQRKPLREFFNVKVLRLMPILLTVVGVIAFMMVNSILIEWNANLKFPSFLKGFEQYAMAKEEQLKELTEFLTTFHSFGDFSSAMLVMALIPAIGEEFLFRGLLQHHLMRICRNPHVAIWLAAFIFGFIHFQFYGLLPRMMLGVLFGYLYYWSGSLVFPMLGHFINNGFTLFFLYLFQIGHTSYDLDSVETLPWPILGICLLIGLWFLWSFKKYFSPQSRVN